MLKTNEFSDNFLSSLYTIEELRDNIYLDNMIMDGEPSELYYHPINFERGMIILKAVDVRKNNIIAYNTYTLKKSFNLRIKNGMIKKSSLSLDKFNFLFLIYYDEDLDDCD